MSAAPQPGAAVSRGWARRDAALVASGLGLFALVNAYVTLFGTAVPCHDDLTQVAFADSGLALDPGALWAQHNEHRLPLPRLVFLTLLRSTHDFRSATLLGPWLLAAAALALMLCARRLRGRSSVADVFFPLALFSLGQSENMLNGFQLAFLIPIALASGLVALLAGARGDASVGRSALAGGLALALALCGAFGLILSFATAAWIVACTLRGADPSGEGTRASRASAIALASGVLALGTATLVGLDLQHPGHALDPGSALAAAGRFLACWLGALGPDAWPWSGLLTAVLELGALVAILAQVRREPARRAAWLGLAALLAGHCVVALAVGFGRAGDEDGAGFASRYATLSALGPAIVFVAASAVHARPAARIVQGFLCAAALLGYGASFGPGVQSGRDRLALASAIESDVQRGWSYSELASSFAAFCFRDRDRYEAALRELDRLGLAPFRRPPGPDHRLLLGRDPATGDLHGPDRVDPGPARAEWWRGADGLIVASGTQLTWDVPARSRVVRGRFGVLHDEQHAGSAGVSRFVVEVVDAEGSVQARFERSVGAAESRARDGLFDFGLDLGRDGARTLVLRYEVEGAAAPGFWGDVRAR